MDLQHLLPKKMKKPLPLKKVKKKAEKKQAQAIERDCCPLRMCALCGQAVQTPFLVAQMGRGLGHVKRGLGRGKAM